MILNAYRFGAAVPLWTPANLSAAYWFDPDDAGHRTVVSNAVSALLDKHGEAFSLIQSTSGFRPALVVGELNGKDVMHFDGADDVLASVNVNVHAGEWSVFAVVKSDAGANGVILAQDKDNSPRIAQYARHQTNSVETIAFNAAESAFVAAQAATLTDWHIIGSVRSSTTITPYVNGSAGTPVSCTGTPESDTMPLLLGARNGGAVFDSYFDGHVAMALIAPSALTTTEEQKIHGWIAHEYGLTALLPSGHPYKTEPPIQ